MIRTSANIIITGTPGCGKTTHAKAVAAKLAGYKLLSVSDYAKENNFIDSYDENLDTHVVDEEKLLDDLEPQLEKGGLIVDWHVCEVFPERLIDLVVVLRTDNAHLHDRLTARGYKDNKIQENLDCEIMEVIVQEARGAYKPEIVVELTSNSDDEIADNVSRVVEWEANWRKDHPEGVSGEKKAADEGPLPDVGSDEDEEDPSEESFAEDDDESDYEEEALDDDDDDDEKADYDDDGDDDFEEDDEKPKKKRRTR